MLDLYPFSILFNKIFSKYYYYYCYVVLLVSDEYPLVNVHCVDICPISFAKHGLENRHLIATLTYCSTLPCYLFVIILQTLNKIIINIVIQLSEIYSLKISQV